MSNSVSFKKRVLRGGTLRRRWAVGFLVSLAVGCGAGEDKDDAKEVLRRHFEAVRDSAYERAMEDYGEPFFQRIAHAEWASSLATIAAKLGRFQRYEVMEWNISRRVGLAGGTYVALVCQVWYSKFPAREELTLFRQRRGERFRIVGHVIRAPQLTQERRTPRGTSI